MLIVLLLMFIAISVILVISTVKTTKTVIEITLPQDTPLSDIAMDLLPVMMGVAMGLFSIILLVHILTTLNIFESRKKQLNYKKRALLLKSFPQLTAVESLRLELRDFDSQYPKLFNVLSTIDNEFKSLDAKKVDSLVSEYYHEMNLIASIQEMKLSLPEKHKYLEEIETVLVNNENKAKQELLEQTVDIEFDIYKKLNS
ncbi:MAG: hypothetical protein ABS904_00680 [Solibacillus isronensis]